MTTWTSIDRWTCPTCRITEVPAVPDAELPAAIRALQEQHAKDHPAPREEPTRTTQVACLKSGARR